MKVQPVVAELFHVDRQNDRRTDVTQIIVTFGNFANAPKKVRISNLTLKVDVCSSSISIANTE